MIAASVLSASAVRHVARAGETARLLVAGPPGGRLDGLAAALRPALLRGLGSDAELEVRTAGGEDGVTGANQFQAWFTSEGDGTSLLLLPGAVGVAWLVGDPRSKYDFARWLPLLCGIGSGVLACRRPIGAARAADPWRVGLADPPGPAAPCLLGLDLLGIPAQPRIVDNPAAALGGGTVDAAFLRPDATGAALGAGATPMFSLGAPELPDAPDPGFPDVPSLTDLVRRGPRAADPLARALHAASAAALLDYALVMPALTPASSVAMWRAAAAPLAGLSDLRGPIGGGARAIAAPGCLRVQSAISVAPGVLLAYRSWLGDRLGYRPG
jgi:hypothetical protein